MALDELRELVRVANLALEHMEKPPHQRGLICRKCLAAEAIEEALHGVIFRPETEYPISIKEKKTKGPKRS